MNTKDDEQTAFVNAIAMDVKQVSTNYASRVCRLNKLQIIKLRDSQQNYNQLKEVFSLVQNKKHAKWKMEHLRSYGFTGFKIQIFVS